MKHPAILMRGTPTGGFIFMVTNAKGNIILTSSSYETEEECKEGALFLAEHTAAAQDNIIDQLPSTIAHQ